MRRAEQNLNKAGRRAGRGRDGERAGNEGRTKRGERAVVWHPAIEVGTAGDGQGTGAEGG